MNRKQRRSLGKQAKKEGDVELEQKMHLFGKLPDECLSCSKSFNKQDKDMVSTWQVVVREEEGKVNLYCPTCWNAALEVTKDFKKYLEEKNERST